MTLRASNLRLAFSASAIALFALPSAASAATCVWNGGTGNWSPAGGWSACAVPTSTDDVAILAGGSVVNINGITANAGTINLGSGNALNIVNSTLFVFSSGVTNNGAFTIGGAGTSDLRSGSGTVTVGGTGVFALNDIAGAARLFGGGWIFGSGQTVRGSGQIGVNQMIVTNNGLISADVNTRNLSIDVTGGNGGVGAGNGFGTGGNAGLFNTGAMEAKNGGTLSFEGGLYENSAAGVIRALAGSVVNLNGDSRILNGTLTSVGTGVIQAFNTAQYLTNVTLSTGSNLKVQNNFLFANTSLVNNGTITIGGAAGTADLRAENDLTISGSGTIVLNDSLGAARIFANKITFGSNQSLTGSGQLGVNQTLVVNNGLFSANSGSNLSIDVTGGNGGILGGPGGTPGGGLGTASNSGLLNTNIMEATGGSTISFEGGLYENAVGGIIRATNGSTINLNNDSRILNGTLTSDATSEIHAFNQQQYLTNATLSAGSNLKVKNDFLFANSTLTNNGTITIGGAGTSDLRAESATLAINGTGTIILDNSAGAARIFSGNITFGAGQTVQGAGQLGVNQTVFTNNGFISANAGTGISIDVTGGSGGTGAGGVGTGNNSGLLNNGTIQGANGKTLALEGGRYENNATGTFGATGAGSVFVMNGDANLTNLQAGNVLKLGSYVSSTAGAASTLNIRGTGANSISTIGTGTAGTDTTVTLSGANSVMNVTNFGSGVNTTLDSSLTTVATSGRLNVLGGRNMTIVAAPLFTNAGIVQLGGGTFGSANYTNSGLTTGFGTITAPINNTGTVEAAGGTLVTNTILGFGTMRSNAAATLDISSAAADSSAGFLTNNGNLTLGTRNVLVNSDYTNAAFGSGNAFNAHANVSGTGLINATSATMDLSGLNLVGNTLNVGNVRTGGSSSTTLTITNNGTATTLRGAVQNTLAPSVALAGADWAIGPNGGNTTVTISYTGLAAGSLSGQTLNVVNNFDNVADRTIGLIGNIYQVAQAGALPASLTLGARRVGDAAATAGFAIANVAPVTPGFNEDLKAVSSVSSGFTLNGLGGLTSVVGAGNTTSVTLSHGTATAGAFSSTVSIANTSLAVPGSGLSDLALAGQSINVLGNVYAKAIASVSPTTVNFGVVRKNAASPTGSVGVTNTGSGALVDTLVTSTSGMPAGVSATSPGALAAGASGNVNFALNTGTAGIVSGSGSLNFKSTNGEMADLTLASQSVAFTGTVTELASAAIFKNAGLGTFAGGGNAFTLNLGSLATNSGVFTTDLGVTNLVASSAFAELLGGSFTQGAGTGFSFAGNSFTNLAGGMSNLGNLLSFDTTGLVNGTYTKQVTFNGFSSFTGLNNFSLTPINLNVTATVTGNIGGAVPEPATWMMMLFGFGLIGSSVRRNRLAVARQLV